MNFLKVKQGVNKKFIQPIVMYHRRKKYRNMELSVISSNCIGGGICHDFAWRFNSPTINLFMMPKDYLCFVENLSLYLKSTLEFLRMENGYPVGVIGGGYFLL